MPGKKIGIAVVGAGRWGPNLIRNFSALDACTIRWVCDVDAERALRAATPIGARVSTSLTEVLDDDGVQAVAIATPAASHGELVRECLEVNRHVFVEKPSPQCSGTLSRTPIWRHSGT